MIAAWPILFGFLWAAVIVVVLLALATRRDTVDLALSAPVNDAHAPGASEPGTSSLPARPGRGGQARRHADVLAQERAAAAALACRGGRVAAAPQRCPVNLGGPDGDR